MIGSTMRAVVRVASPVRWLMSTWWRVALVVRFSCVGWISDLVASRGPRDTRIEGVAGGGRHGRCIGAAVAINMRAINPITGSCR